nr:hypothetical protein GCM10020063_046520 [Dactylosporangium thailandense]
MTRARSSVLLSAAAAGWWLASQLLFPPVAAGVGGAVVVTGFAIGAVLLLGARRGGHVRDSVPAALGVAVLTPLLIFALVTVLSAYGPAWVIPDLVPMALSPADDLANSRIELQDPYVALLPLVALAALALGGSGLLRRRSSR